MAKDSMALVETLRKAIADGDVDFLRAAMGVLSQAVMEAEVSELTGLPHGERNPERRLTHRNGYRERRWDAAWARSTLPSRACATAPTQHAAGRRPGPCARARRHRQERGQPQPRRRALPIPAARCDLRQGQRGRPGGQAHRRAPEPPARGWPPLSLVSVAGAQH